MEDKSYADGNAQEGKIIMTLYETNTGQWQFFLDYRQKFMFRFFIAIGAVFGVVLWLLEHRIGSLLFVPLAVMAIISFIFLLIELRTSMVLVACHRVGYELERKMAGMSVSETKDKSFYKDLQIVLWTTSMTLLWVVLSIVFPIRDFAARSWWRKLGNELHRNGEITHYPIGFFSSLTILFQVSLPHTLILRTLYSSSTLFFLVLTVWVTCTDGNWFISRMPPKSSSTSTAQSTMLTREMFMAPHTPEGESPRSLLTSK